MYVGEPVDDGMGLGFEDHEAMTPEIYDHRGPYSFIPCNIESAIEEEIIEEVRL